MGEAPVERGFLTDLQLRVTVRFFREEKAGLKYTVQERACMRVQEAVSVRESM